MGRERGEGGRYQETVSVDAVLDLFTDTEPRTTSEVAAALDVAQKTAYNKLQALTERGDIRKKKIGGLAVVWWRPDPPETRE